MRLNIPIASDVSQGVGFGLAGNVEGHGFAPGEHEVLFDGIAARESHPDNAHDDSVMREVSAPASTAHPQEVGDPRKTATAA